MVQANAMANRLKKIGKRPSVACNKCDLMSMLCAQAISLLQQFQAKHPLATTCPHLFVPNATSDCPLHRNLCTVYELRCDAITSCVAQYRCSVNMGSGPICSDTVNSFLVHRGNMLRFSLSKDTMCMAVFCRVTMHTSLAVQFSCQTEGVCLEGCCWWA
jgi:hypothetical protein